MYHPYLFGGRVETVPQGGLCHCKGWRLINSVGIDGFNLYYRALRDTPPRPGSTIHADWLSLPFPSPGRAPFRRLYGRGFESL